MLKYTNMKIRLKVHITDGKKLVALSATTSHISSDKLLVLFSDENESIINVTMTIDQYNSIPYSWFEEIGPAPHGTAIKPISLF